MTEMQPRRSPPATTTPTASSQRSAASPSPTSRCRRPRPPRRRRAHPALDRRLRAASRGLPDRDLRQRDPRRAGRVLLPSPQPAGPRRPDRRPRLRGGGADGRGLKTGRTSSRRWAGRSTRPSRSRPAEAVAQSTLATPRPTTIVERLPVGHAGSSRPSRPPARHGGEGCQPARHAAGQPRPHRRSSRPTPKTNAPMVAINETMGFEPIELLVEWSTQARPYVRSSRR